MRLEWMSTWNLGYRRAHASVRVSFRLHSSTRLNLKALLTVASTQNLSLAQAIRLQPASQENHTPRHYLRLCPYYGLNHDAKSVACCSCPSLKSLFSSPSILLPQGRISWIPGSCSFHSYDVYTSIPAHWRQWGMASSRLAFQHGRLCSLNFRISTWLPWILCMNQVFYALRKWHCL